MVGGAFHIHTISPVTSIDRRGQFYGDLQGGF
jgi:hypothetical protein